MADGIGADEEVALVRIPVKPAVGVGKWLRGCIGDTFSSNGASAWSLEWSNGFS
jgi:hypothetical protein